MGYLLDTNICVFFLRGYLDLDVIIKEKGLENIYISELTVFELRYGAENSENSKKSHKAVDKFINGLSIVPIYGCVDEYAKTKVYLKKNGTPMHDEIDLIIGATALANNFTLITDNLKDFRFIQDLKMENWIKKKN
ncbi:MAG: PIN domain-containing protein [Flavobacteriia bacterium]|nr:PIN domain-containing protein [Flavobacteriia bacterium]